MRFVLVGVVLVAAIGAAVSCTLNVAGRGDPFEQGTGGTGGTGGGDGIPCSSDASCEDDTPCANWKCSTTGFCEVSFAADGTPIAGSIVGDCREIVCGPGGTEILRDDDDDIFDDGNDCTEDLCADGVPQHPPVDDGDACGVAGEGLYCSGGVCVGCEMADQCSANPCQDPTCTQGTCGTTPKAAGTEVDDASPLDCLHEVCNGAGTTMVDADPDDDPDDMNACTADSCDGPAPSYEAVVNGSMCPTGFCYQGACSQCGIDTNCPVGDCEIPACNGGTCAPPTDEPDGTACGTNGQDACCMGVCQPNGCGGGSGGGGMGGGGGAGGNP